MSKTYAESYMLEGDGGKSNYKKRYAIYAGHQIILFKNQDDKQERGIIDIKYARMRETVLICGKLKMNGFILMARGNRMFFSTETLQQQMLWLDALRKSCVLLDI